jgi:hypothetical protein
MLARQLLTDAALPPPLHHTARLGEKSQVQIFLHLAIFVLLPSGACMLEL